MSNPGAPQPIIPLTLLSGYLGAGKTTRVNRLLASSQLRVAVLVNDFGSINIDERLIENRAGTTLSLSNGCVCCSVTDDLGSAIEQVVKLDPFPEHVLIETSGVANPEKVAAQASSWAELGEAQISVVVDAASVLLKVNDKFVGNTVRQQIACADSLIVSKKDMVDSEGLGHVRRLLHDLAPKAALCERLELERTARQSPLAEPDSSPHSTAAFTTVTFESSTPINRERFEQWATDACSRLERLKGFAFFSDNLEQPFRVEIASRTLTIAKTRAAPLSSGSQLVLISAADPADRELERLRQSLYPHKP